MNPLRALSAVGWMVVGLLVLALITLGTCQALKASRGAARQAEAGQTLAEGRTAAAQDASAIRDRADERTRQTDGITQETTDAILQAPDRAAAERAALRGLCRHDPRADARCGVLLADPRRVD